MIGYKLSHVWLCVNHNRNHINFLTLHQNDYQFCQNIIKWFCWLWPWLHGPIYYMPLILSPLGVMFVSYILDHVLSLILPVILLVKRVQYFCSSQMFCKYCIMLLQYQSVLQLFIVWYMYLSTIPYFSLILCTLTHCNAIKFTIFPNWF